MGGEERRLLPSRFEKRYAACPSPRPGSRWRAGARPAWGSWTSAARLRTGGEEESPQTGDSNPGCNCLVRGYSPSMHFFWGGDMPHYSPPLPFRRGRAGARAFCPARGAPGSGVAVLRAVSRAQTCVPVRAPGPGAGVAVLRAVWRAQARAPGHAGRRARARRGGRGRPRHG